MKCENSINNIFCFYFREIGSMGEQNFPKIHLYTICSCMNHHVVYEPSYRIDDMMNSLNWVKLNKRWEKHLLVMLLNALFIVHPHNCLLILRICNLFIHIALEAEPQIVFSLHFGTLFLERELFITGHVHVIFGIISPLVCYYVWACMYSFNKCVSDYI